MLIGQVLRASSFLAVERLVRSSARRALAVSTSFSDDALGYFTERLDRAGGASSPLRPERSVTGAFRMVTLLDAARDNAGTRTWRVDRGREGTSPPWVHPRNHRRTMR